MASRPRCDLKIGSTWRTATCQQLWPFLPGSWCPACAKAGEKNIATR